MFALWVVGAGADRQTCTDLSTKQCMSKSLSSKVSVRHAALHHRLQLKSFAVAAFLVKYCMTRATSAVLHQKIHWWRQKHEGDNDGGFYYVCGSPWGSQLASALLCCSEECLWCRCTKVHFLFLYVDKEAVIVIFTPTQPTGLQTWLYINQ